MLVEPHAVEVRSDELARLLGAAASDEQIALAVLLLGQVRDQEALGPLVGVSKHSSAAVRRAAAEALPMAMLSGEHSTSGVEALIDLSADADAEVRDWAVCSLGRTLAGDRRAMLAYYDTAEIRAALVARLVDADPATRAEACAGLAMRGVGGAVVRQLQIELARPEVGRVPVLAAEALGASELYDSLVGMRSWWMRDPQLLERAIRACTPEPPSTSEV